MSQGRYLIDMVYGHVEKNGREGLLPQNLTDELLNRMILEADAIGEDRTEVTPSSVLLMAIMLLQDNSSISNLTEVEITHEALVKCFEQYIAAIVIEYERRKKATRVCDEFFPTLENIFTYSR